MRMGVLLLINTVRTISITSFLGYGFFPEDWMAWCGVLINTTNLEVRSDYTRYGTKSEWCNEAGFTRWCSSNVGMSARMEYNIFTVRCVLALQMCHFVNPGLWDCD